MTSKTNLGNASLLGLSLLAAGCADKAAAAPAAAPQTTSASVLDVTVAAPQHYKVLVDNPSVRVIECVLLPGEKDSPHTHAAGWYYVTKPGAMRVVKDGKDSRWDAKEGEAGWMEAEAPHTSENIGTAPMGFILVEVKSASR